LNSSKTSQPAKPWQSKLTPYAREIAAWRRQKPPKTYAEIAGILSAHHGLSVHPDTIHSFVKVRSKSGRKYLKISPHFLRKESAKNAGSPQPKLTAKETVDKAAGQLLGLPPKSYPVVNPNQL